jgi:putative acetyltransferase
VIRVIEAQDAPALEAARALFRAYAAGEPDELCLAGFAAEVAGLPGAYAPPAGRLLLARDDGRAVGCIGLAPGPAAGEAEIRRLYVAPGHRGTGAGRALAEAALAAARAAGYSAVTLETRDHMDAARALYRRLGFTDRGRDGPILRMSCALASAEEDA